MRLTSFFVKGKLVSSRLSRLSTTEETIKVELSKNYELSLFTFLHRNEVEPYVEVIRTCPRMEVATIWKMLSVMPILGFGLWHCEFTW